VKHNEKQRIHYADQYASSKISLKYEKDADLWEWGKWYPLLILEDFIATIHGKSIIISCCGIGREIGLFHKYGIQTTATDLTIDHLAKLHDSDIIRKLEIQNAERLIYEDNSFDYGFVNAGLHHLRYPHMGLCELLRTAREAAIFIESQDSLLHAIRRFLGYKQADFESAGNYVYRWKRREIEKISLSAHAHSFGIKTSFLPLSIKMRKTIGYKKKLCKITLKILNKFLGKIGNVMIVIIFKRTPTDEQLAYLSSHRFYYKINRYPEVI